LNRGVKLRVGIILWALSWVPYGVILGLSGKALTAAWAAEITLGIVGLALAGTEFAQAVKVVGWKGAPKVAWHALLHGSDIEDAEVVP
jgi:hypothetical protein